MQRRVVGTEGERDKVEREIDSKLTIATQPAAKASGADSAQAGAADEHFRHRMAL